MDSVVQILKIGLQVCLVVLPCQAIHPGGSLTLKRLERLPQQINGDMVQQCGERLLPPLPCSVPDTVQPRCHAGPAQCPGRAWMARVPLGPRPWLRPLRGRCPGFVRRLRCYYDEVRLLRLVHHRLRLLAFPMRAAG